MCVNFREKTVTMNNSIIIKILDLFANKARITLEMYLLLLLKEHKELPQKVFKAVIHTS